MLTGSFTFVIVEEEPVDDQDGGRDQCRAEHQLCWRE